MFYIHLTPKIKTSVRNDIGFSYLDDFSYFQNFLSELKEKYMQDYTLDHVWHTCPVRGKVYIDITPYVWN